MKFTLSWLQEFLDFNEPLDKILDTLTFAGLEVEEVQDLGAKLAGFTVAEITDFTKHPDADKLNICSVNSIEGTHQIVCGAPNVKANMKVILAPIGAIVPANGMKIKKVKIRGVESCGMMCSLSELGEGDNHEGIVEVDSKFAIGTKAAEVFNLDDVLIELAITPNRGDACSVFGIARELAANNIGKLKTIETQNHNGAFNSKTIITNENPEIFKQFNLVEIRNVKNCDSPLWLQNRLKAIGIAPKSALVDITNYICITFGQPMHCYDKAKISGNFNLALLKEDEEFDGLDDKNYNLEANDLVIRDTKKIIALAGILGSSNSATEISSSDILLEAAEFDHIALTKTARKHQINSESRFRFERQIDSENVERSLTTAVNMIQEICGGEASNIISISKIIDEPIEISLTYKKLNNYLGLAINADEIKSILTKLNFKIITSSHENLVLSPPSYRNDVSEDIDVIEEIARIYGMNKISEQKFDHQVINPSLIEESQDYILRKKLAACGLHEMTNFPFVTKDDNANFDLAHQAILLVNPINARENQLRVSLISSLIKQIHYIQTRDLQINAFFEIGKVCFYGKDKIKEEKRLGIIRSGNRSNKEINNDSLEYDLFDIKSDLEEICKTLGIQSTKLAFKRAQESFLHPSKSYNITYAGNNIGIIGELHPTYRDSYDVKGKPQILELILDNIRLNAKKSKNYFINDLQKINRDLAFVLPIDIEAGQVKKEIQKKSPEIIQNVFITDIYQGDKISEGFKSVAFNICLQPINENFNSKQIDAIINDVIAHIENKFKCKLRA